jgi:hypothetical protein
MEVLCSLLHAPLLSVRLSSSKGSWLEERFDGSTRTDRNKRKDRNGLCSAREERSATFITYITYITFITTRSTSRFLIALHS